MSNRATYTELVSELLRQSATLVAVSKTKPVEQIMQLYNWGQRVFGENRVEELAQKYPVLPNDIEWHMIGHLQSKKVKKIAGFVTLIHSIDTIKLLQIVDKEAAKHNRQIDILLQFKIATEESKYGLPTDEIALLPDLHEFGNIRYRGVMGMASFVQDEETVRSEFKRLYQAFTQLKRAQFADNRDFNTVSMGMSGDYRIALEEGSNMVRIGSMLFGPRN